MPKGIPLSEEVQASRRHEIFHRVVNVFVKKGFHKTSVLEIAETAGLGKSTSYDYFKTKDEILIYLFEDHLNDMTEEAQRIVMQNLTADKHLCQIMELYLESLQANKYLFLKLIQESQQRYVICHLWFAHHRHPSRNAERDPGYFLQRH